MDLSDSSLLALGAIPLIGALIGWVTNYVAVKMLFHPKTPVRVLGIPVQGVFPKRQLAFAKKLGTLVASQLLSNEDVTSSLKHAAAAPEVREVIGQHVEKAINEQLPQAFPMLAAMLTPELVSRVKGVILKDVDTLIIELTSHLSGKLNEVLDIEQLVERKVAAFSSDKLEEVLLSIMRREFRFIELVGGILGFMIGVVQLLLARGFS